MYFQITASDDLQLSRACPHARECLRFLGWAGPRDSLPDLVFPAEYTRYTIMTIEWSWIILLLCVYLGLLYISAANIEMQRWHQTQYPVYVPVNMSFMNKAVTWPFIYYHYYYHIILYKDSITEFQKEKNSTLRIICLVLFCFVFIRHSYCPTPWKRDRTILDKNKVWSLFGTWGKQNKILKKCHEILRHTQKQKQWSKHAPLYGIIHKVAPIFLSQAAKIELSYFGF